MKIAIIRFSALGDIASLSPIVKALKYKPTIITTQLGKEYLKDEYDSFLILKNKSIMNVLKLIYMIRKMKFDIVVDFQCNDRSRFITKTLNSKIYNNENIDVYNNSSFQIFNMILEGSGLLNNIKIDFRKKEKNYIVLNCGSSPKWVSKRLPLEKWKEISQTLYDKYKLPFYLTGDKTEIEYIKKVEKYIAGEKINLVGKTNIQELKAILKNAYLVISTDSAPMHISAVQGTPTVGIFGSTNWIRSKPFGAWSTAIYDKILYPDGIPPRKNTMQAGNYYNNINILDGINDIERYLHD